MFIDSHCHLSFPELRAQLPVLLEAMASAHVQQAICICTTLEEFPDVLALAEANPQLFATVGVHPDNEGVREPSTDELVRLAQHPKVLAIGETGLDYYRLNGRSVADMAWQRERFRAHIRAAKATDKPLVVHTRSSSEDTLAVLAEEGGGAVRGVFHCFTEDLATAQ
jgi:TatD DNase family protein